MTADDVIEGALARTEELFYKRDARRFRQHQDALKKALTYPASWLNSRGVSMPAKWHAEILKRILDEIAKFGARKVHYFPAYVLTCVKGHMDHKGEAYYEAAKVRKTPPNAPAIASEVLSTLRTLPTRQERDQTTEILAQAHKILSHRVRTRRPTKNTRSA